MATRVEKLAAKLWACGTDGVGAHFETQHPTVKTAWIDVARLALRELKAPKRIKTKRKSKRPRPRSCSINARGKRVCA